MYGLPLSNVGRRQVAATLTCILCIFSYACSFNKFNSLTLIPGVLLPGSLSLAAAFGMGRIRNSRARFERVFWVENCFILFAFLLNALMTFMPPESAKWQVFAHSCTLLVWGCLLEAVLDLTSEMGFSQIIGTLPMISLLDLKLPPATFALYSLFVVGLMFLSKCYGYFVLPYHFGPEKEEDTA